MCQIFISTEKKSIAICHEERVTVDFILEINLEYQNMYIYILQDLSNKNNFRLFRFAFYIISLDEILNGARLYIATRSVLFAALMTLVRSLRYLRAGTNRSV